MFTVRFCFAHVLRMNRIRLSNKHLWRHGIGVLLRIKLFIGFYRVGKIVGRNRV